MQRLTYQKAAKKKAMIVMRWTKEMMGNNSIYKKKIWKRAWKISII